MIRPKNSSEWKLFNYVLFSIFICIGLYFSIKTLIESNRIHNSKNVGVAGIITKKELVGRGLFGVTIKDKYNKSYLFTFSDRDFLKPKIGDSAHKKINESCIYLYDKDNGYKYAGYIGHK